MTDPLLVNDSVCLPPTGATDKPDPEIVTPGATVPTIAFGNVWMRSLVDGLLPFTFVVGVVAVFARQFSAVVPAAVAVEQAAAAPSDLATSAANPHAATAAP